MPPGRRMQEVDEGRSEAFQRLAHQRLDSSYRLATAILRDDTDAQDAVHDAVLVAWRRWSTLRDRSKFEAWFDHIVVNVCRDRLKAARYRYSHNLDDAANVRTPDIAPDVHRRMVVDEALDRLKADDIVVIALRHFLDLQLDDIATLLDVPLPTAKTRLRSARLRLREQLEPDPH